MKIENLGVMKSNDVYIIANKSGENVLANDLVFIQSHLAYNWIANKINNGHTHFFAYAGEVPNTGVKWCPVCYLRWGEHTNALPKL